MFVILLKFTENKAKAGKHMAAHKAWIQHGFNDGVFLVMGSLKPDLGGALIAHRSTLQELEARVAEDPFVAEKVVTAEILEVAGTRADERLQFLTENRPTLI